MSNVIPFFEEVGQVWGLVISKRMRPLIPQMLWTGISLAIYSGLLVPIIVATLPNESTNDQFEKSMFAMTAFGVGEVLGGLFIGQIIDRFGNRVAAVCNICLITTQTIVVIVFLYFN